MNKDLDIANQLDLLGSQENSLPINPEKKRPLLEKVNNDSSLKKKSPEMLLIVDTETTGLDFSEDRCIEVGAILFNVPNRSILAQQSFLIPAEDNKAEAINHIPAQITRLDQPLEQAINYLKSLIETVDVLVAHNAQFDRKWFGKNDLPLASKPWLCSMEDISWPAEKNLRPRPSVRDLALAYEVPVWSAHRALTDCIYLAEVFRRCPDLEDLLNYGLEPRRLMKAQVSYDQRHLAKEAGFRWNEPIKGAWTKRLSEQEISDLNFPVVVISSDD